MTDRDNLLLQTILTDLREMREEIKELRETVAQVRGGWKAVSAVSSIIGAGAGGLAAWLGKGGIP